MRAGSVRVFHSLPESPLGPAGFSNLFPNSGGCPAATHTFTHAAVQSVRSHTWKQACAINHSSHWGSMFEKKFDKLGICTNNIF